MPISDGLELVRGVRSSQALRALPVVMMSATRKDVALSGQSKEGPPKVTAFLHKPFELEGLLDTIKRLIGKGEARKR